MEWEWEWEWEWRDTDVWDVRDETDCECEERRTGAGIVQMEVSLVVLLGVFVKWTIFQACNNVRSTEM